MKMIFIDLEHLQISSHSNVKLYFDPVNPDGNPYAQRMGLPARKRGFMYKSKTETLRPGYERVYSLRAFCFF